MTTKRISRSTALDIIRKLRATGRNIANDDEEAALRVNEERDKVLVCLALCRASGRHRLLKVT